jgi:hypothetical protein
LGVCALPGIRLGELADIPDRGSNLPWDTIIHQRFAVHKSPVGNLLPAGLFCARCLVFSSAFTYSDQALGKVLKGTPLLADNPDSQGRAAHLPLGCSS